MEDAALWPPRAKEGVEVGLFRPSKIKAAAQTPSARSRVGFSLFKTARGPGGEIVQSALLFSLCGIL